jgi:tetratricopeptide (TPR) repeat protein
MLSLRALPRLLAGALCLSAPAFAQPAPSFTIAVCPGPAAAGEAADQRTVDAALTSFTHGGFSALERHLPLLERVLANAPECHPQIERRDGEVIVRTSNNQDFMIISAAIGAAAQELGQRTSIRMGPNPYADASLVLASYAVEQRRYADALPWLDRGLALQPSNASLIMEKATALAGLRRFDEAHALLQGALDSREMALTLDRARFLRVNGIVLIDLERLDDAEAMLNESIRLQPNNPVARQELEYIAQLRAGADRRNFTITAPNAPKPETQ